MKKLVTALSYFPAFMLILYGSFVFRSYLYLNGLPTFSDPDPKDLGFDLHHDVIWGLTLVFAPMAIVAWLFLSYKYPVSLMHKVIFVSSICLSLVFTLVFHELINWFLD